VGTVAVSNFIALALVPRAVANTESFLNGSALAATETVARSWVGTVAVSWVGTGWL
jgi:hypothetical protein